MNQRIQGIVAGKDLCFQVTCELVNGFLWHPNSKQINGKFLQPASPVKANY